MKSVRQTLTEILAAQLDVPIEDIEDGNSIADDLGADSLDEIELLMECEQRFGIEIPDETARSGRRWVPQWRGSRRTAPRSYRNQRRVGRRTNA